MRDDRHIEIAKNLCYAIKHGKSDFYGYSDPVDLVAAALAEARTAALEEAAADLLACDQTGTGWGAIAADVVRALTNSDSTSHKTSPDQ